MKTYQEKRDVNTGIETNIDKLVSRNLNNVQILYSPCMVLRVSEMVEKVKEARLHEIQGKYDTLWIQVI